MNKSLKMVLCAVLSLSVAGSAVSYATGVHNKDYSPDEIIFGEVGQDENTQPSSDVTDVPENTEKVEESENTEEAAEISVEPAIGDVIGEILSTDIVAYVEGVRVNSYNIKGRTALIAQDLKALGTGLNYGVSFDEESRVLTLTDKDVFSLGTAEPLVVAESEKNLPVGTVVGNVLYTDITTNFNGASMESFNIDGLTCIYADDLGKMCGTYLWDEETRRVDIYRKSSHIPFSVKEEAGRVLPAEESVIEKPETFNRWGAPALSNLILNSDGTYTALEVGENIDIENYDESFKRTSSFSIKKELPLFGALYVGKDYNYIAYGQENLLEDNSREVIRIVIYDKKFVKISEVSVSNCKTAIPFDASGAQMSENDRYLVLHTSRSQYADEEGNRPQTQLTVIIDKHTWTVNNILGKYQYNHISHALQEFVKFDGDRIITANYSDAAPLRGAFLQEIDSQGKVVFTHSIFNMGGPWTTSYTGGMTGGFEISDKGYLVPLSTIDPYTSADYENPGEETRDIYVTWTDKETFEMRHTCLARYTGTGLTGSVPYIVRLEDGNFMVMWQQFSGDSDVSETVCYAFIGPDGKQIGKTYTVKAQLSESCKPIVYSGKAIWYVNTEDNRYFYGINCQIPVEEEEKDDPVTEEDNTTDDSENTEKDDNIVDDEKNPDKNNSDDDRENEIIKEVEGI